MSLAQLWKSEVNKKTRLIHQSNPKMTRRANCGSLNPGFRQDRTARYKIQSRMFSKDS
jgi:hypothetical protein